MQYFVVDVDIMAARLLRGIRGGRGAGENDDVWTLGGVAIALFLLSVLWRWQVRRRRAKRDNLAEQDRIREQMGAADIQGEDAQESPRDDDEPGFDRSSDHGKNPPKKPDRLDVLMNKSPHGSLGAGRSRPAQKPLPPPFGSLHRRELHCTYMYDYFDAMGRFRGTFEDPSHTAVFRFQGLEVDEGSKLRGEIHGVGEDTRLGRFAFDGRFDVSSGKPYVRWEEIYPSLVGVVVVSEGLVTGDGKHLYGQYVPNTGGPVGKFRMAPLGAVEQKDDPDSRTGGGEPASGSKDVAPEEGATVPSAGEGQKSKKHRREDPRAPPRLVSKKSAVDLVHESVPKRVRGKKSRDGAKAKSGGAVESSEAVGAPSTSAPKKGWSRSNSRFDPEWHENMRRGHDESVV